MVRALLAAAKAPPRSPCNKNAKNSWSKVLDVFAPATVLAQQGCSSSRVSHYNTVQYPNANCTGFRVCMGAGGDWTSGCTAEEYNCQEGGSLCGQITCYNPGY